MTIFKPSTAVVEICPIFKIKIDCIVPTECFSGPHK